MKKNPKNIKKREFYGLQSLDNKITHLLKPIFNYSKKEFIIINNLVKNWSQIVGQKYSNLCSPKSVNLNNKTQDGKLTIAVFNPAVGFFIEQNSEIIIERIATLYGYKSIKKIIIKQEPKQIHQLKNEKKISDKSVQEKITHTIANIENPELKSVLDQLAKDIFGKN